MIGQQNERCYTGLHPQHQLITACGYRCRFRSGATIIHLLFMDDIRMSLGLQVWPNGYKMPLMSRQKVPHTAWRSPANISRPFELSKEEGED